MLHTTLPWHQPGFAVSPWIYGTVFRAKRPKEPTLSEGISFRLHHATTQSAFRIPILAKPAARPSAHSTAKNDPSSCAPCDARASPRFHATKTRPALQLTGAGQTSGTLLPFA